MSRLSPLAPVTLGLLILVGCSSTPSIPPRGADVTDSHVASFRQKEDEQLLQKQVSPPLDAPLSLLEAPLPRYPSFLLNDTSSKARGDVTVSFEIMPSGLVGTVRVLSGTGDDALHKPAIDAVRRWKFAPLLRNGEPARLVLQHTFRMEPERPQPAVLPACSGRKEVAVAAARMPLRRSARTAAQHVLVDHELAVVFAHRAFGRAKTGVGGVARL
eukprot:gene33003-55568_t